MSLVAALARAPLRAAAGLGRVPSNRMLKRLRGHPVKWSPTKTLPIPRPEPAPLRWVPERVETNAFDWAPPTGRVPADLPFRVERTTVGQQLPVYTDFRHGRTKCYTIVRKASGDIDTLAAELSKVCAGEPVTVRPGRVEVGGYFARDVRAWLMGLGF